MKKLWFMLYLIGILATTGCTEKVPPGFVGMVMEPGGLTGEVLQPGRHSCWGRDRLILIDASEKTFTEQMDVLCADDLNFKFDLKIRASLNAKSGKEILEVLNKQGAQITSGGITGDDALKFEVLYVNYVRPAARSVARTIVSKYQTTQIRENRESIQKSIQEQLLLGIKGTPVKVGMIVTSNFDYPDVITAAVEKKRKKEIEIEEEKAKQAMELLKADNRLKIAEKMKRVRAAEAEADSVAIQILGKALTSKYLQLKGIEANLVLYEKVGVGDKVIVGGNNGVMPIVNTGR